MQWLRIFLKLKNSLWVAGKAATILENQKNFGDVQDASVGSF